MLLFEPRDAFDSWTLNRLKSAKASNEFQQALLTSVIKLWHWAARFRHVWEARVCAQYSGFLLLAVPLQLSGQSRKSHVGCCNTQSKPAAFSLAAGERQQLVSRFIPAWYQEWHAIGEEAHSPTYMDFSGRQWSLIRLPFQNQETVTRKETEGSRMSATKLANIIFTLFAVLVSAQPGGWQLKSIWRMEIIDRSDLVAKLNRGD